MRDGSSIELTAVEKRIAQSESPEAQPARELRALVTEVATTEHPDSLADLRRLIDAREMPTPRRELVPYVLMDMLDQRELEISSERRLIVHVGA